MSGWKNEYASDGCGLFKVNENQKNGLENIFQLISIFDMNFF
jgi:hypothetical protein